MIIRIFLVIVLVSLSTGMCFGQGFIQEFEYPHGYINWMEDYDLTENDLNGDGTPEIVIRDISGYPSTEIVIFDQTYTEIASYSRGSEMYFKAFADLDGDGDREMLVSYWNDASYTYCIDVVDIFQNVDSWEIGPILGTLQYDSWVGLFDFDHDGKTEIAVREDPTTLQIWEFDGVTSVGESVNPASDPVLNQNYPNPFNPSTVICTSSDQWDILRI